MAAAHEGRPRRFDYDLVVIGAGSAGLVTAYLAAAARARVALVEKGEMGGDCLNTGCVPSKALIRTARAVAEARRAAELGIGRMDVEVDFAQVMERVQRVVRQVAPHDSVERYTALGVECVHGEARLASPWTVRVGERVLTARAIVLATGAGPFVPPLPGLERIDYLTSDNLWELRERPERLAVLGGGPVGCELAQAFARLGSRVTQVEMAGRLLSREDPEVSDRVRERFQAEGMEVLTGVEAQRVDARERVLVCARGDEVRRIPFDRLLVAVGRKPHTRGLGLEELGIRLTARGTLETDAYLRTSVPSVYAAGDVVGPMQFTHVAAHQAWYAAVNALLGLRALKADYSAVPAATFTDPEVARVGLNEQEATARGIPCQATTYDLADLDRAIADGDARGLVKVLTPPGKDRILGATVVGPHAAELIAEWTLAMRHRLGLSKVLGTIHAYPTLAEANKHVAGAWRRAHTSARTLRWLERFFAWRRG
jgi:dihydrolipoamide dehydrogenase